MPRVKLGEVAREYKSVRKDSSNLPIVGLEHIDDSVPLGGACCA